MNIFFYSTFSNKSKWLVILKKKFQKHRIITLNDNVDFPKIDVAIVWNLPNKILKKLTNIKVIFSLGAGVDHILKLPSYAKTPIFRIKDPNMRERMFNYVLSQILNYQLKLIFYKNAQQKKIWLNELESNLNSKVTIGILGLGYIGKFVAKKLNNLNYKIIGYKNTTTKRNLSLKIISKKNLSQFISSSDIIVSILPSTIETENLIDYRFLKKMKKNSLLINIGRGASLCEKDLVNHLKSNNSFYVSLDVFKNEPLKKNHKFWNLPNITITPHIAAITDIESSIEYMYKRFLTINKNNQIKSDVNLKKGY